MALPTQPTRAVVAATMEVEVVDDITDCLFEGFKLGVSAAEIIDVKVEGGARQPSLTEGIDAVNPEVMEGLLNFVVIDDYLVSRVIDGPSFRYDISYGVGDTGVGEPEADYLLACGIEVIFIFN
jgi:hypothetical protein